MSTNKYSVIVENFTERHYIKKFNKKYKQSWNITRQAIIEEFKRVDFLFDVSIATTIIDSKYIKIAKTEFRIAGTKQSRKKSGNRCIIAIHKDVKIVYVLLVYNKNDLVGNDNETALWQQLIKKNYKQYKNLFK